MLSGFFRSSANICFRYGCASSTNLSSGSSVKATLETSIKAFKSCMMFGGILML